MNSPDVRVERVSFQRFIPGGWNTRLIILLVDCKIMISMITRLWYLWTIWVCNDHVASFVDLGTNCASILNGHCSTFILFRVLHILSLWSSFQVQMYGRDNTLLSILTRIDLSVLSSWHQCHTPLPHSLPLHIQWSLTEDLFYSRHVIPGLETE